MTDKKFYTMIMNNDITPEIMNYAKTFVDKIYEKEIEKLEKEKAKRTIYTCDFCGEQVSWYQKVNRHVRHMEDFCICSSCFERIANNHKNPHYMSLLIYCYQMKKKGKKKNENICN